MPNNLADTIVAIITPAGVGGIAVVRVSGRDAVAIADQRFSGRRLLEAPSHTVHHGFYRNEEGIELDEVLATLFRGPNSYTGEDVVEISCHGSPAIAAAIVDD